LLTVHGVIEDDAKLVKVTASWDATIPPGTVRVTADSPEEDVDWPVKRW
jgi:hypothetical protein